MEEQTITLTEAEKIYGVAAGTLRRACWQGRLKARKSGDIWLLSRSELEAWLRTSWAKRRNQH